MTTFPRLGIIYVFSLSRFFTIVLANGDTYVFDILRLKRDSRKTIFRTIRDVVPNDVIDELERVDNIAVVSGMDDSLDYKCPFNPAKIVDAQEMMGLLQKLGTVKVCLTLEC